MLMAVFICSAHLVSLAAGNFEPVDEAFKIALSKPMSERALDISSNPQQHDSGTATSLA
jgi:hypothetical protein